MQPPPRAQVVRAAAPVAAQARRARVAARRAPRDHDAIAGRDGGHALADLLDDSSALVAEQDRKRQAPAARLDHVQVAVADAACLDAHLHLARARRIERDLLDGGPGIRVRIDDAATAHACNLVRCTWPRRSARSDSSPRSEGCAGSSGPASRAQAETKECLRRRPQQLREYFAGTRKAFDLPLDLHGTEFQRRAWLGLAAIPYGATRSYGEQARRLGVPRAARAVGAANGANPLPIVLPCHRLVGADGSLTGFGGGLEVKRWLLDFEATRRETSPRGSARSSR